MSPEFNSTGKIVGWIDFLADRVGKPFQDAGNWWELGHDSSGVEFKETDALSKGANIVPTSLSDNTQGPAIATMTEVSGVVVETVGQVDDTVSSNGTLLAAVNSPLMATEYRVPFTDVTQADAVESAQIVCFPAGTPVLMADGTCKRIEDIQPGDVVLSSPENNPLGEVLPKRVEKVFHNDPSRLMRLLIGDTVLRCTPDHRFFVRTRGWVTAEDLQAGDELRTSEAEWIVLNDAALTDDVEPVYNFRVADYHTYFVGDSTTCSPILVHNACSRLPRNGGVWKTGANPRSGIIQDVAEKVTGYWHSANGTVVKYVDGVPDFSDHVLRWAGKKITIDIPFEGISGSDIDAAEAAFRAKYPQFKGTQYLGRAGTWHHKSFDRRTGKFVMEFVDQNAHKAALHAGGFSQYLDWITDVVKRGGGKITRAEAFARTLSNETLRKKILGRLLQTMSRAEADKLLATALKTTVRTGAKAIPFITVVFAAGSSYASDQSLVKAVDAGIQDLVMKDMWEGAIQLTVCRGSDIIAEKLIKPAEVARKRASQGGIDDTWGGRVYVDAAEQHEEGMYDFKEAVEQADDGRSFWQLLRDALANPLEGKMGRINKDFYD